MHNSFTNVVFSLVTFHNVRHSNNLTASLAALTYIKLSGQLESQINILARLASLNIFITSVLPKGWSCCLGLLRSAK